MIKKIPTLLLVVILLLSACIPEFTLCSAEENQTPEYVLLDLTDSSDISLLGMDTDTDNCLYGGKNATFTQSQISKVNSSGQSTAASTVVATAKNGIITDWSSYTNYNIWIYSEKVTDQKFALVIRDSQNRIYANIMERSFSGWKRFSIPFESFTNKNIDFDFTSIKDFYISLSYSTLKNNDVASLYTKLTFAKIWLSKEGEADYTELFSSFEKSDTRAIFNRGSYATLKSDTEGQVLQLSGSGSNSDESATPLLGEAMDWTGYGYLNFRIKNNSSSDSAFHFYATVNGKEAAAAVGYWRKMGITVNGNEWQTISLPIPRSFEFVKNSSTPIIYDTMSHIEALRFDYITGSMSVEKIWLSQNQPVTGDFLVTGTSIENSASDVSTNLKSVEFTYSQRLSPQNSSKYISIKDVTNSADIESGFEVGTFGNKLQILFTEKLNYNTEYLITVGKDIYGSPIPFASESVALSFTTKKASSDFEAIKDRWVKNLVGDAFNNMNHSYVAYYISLADSDCKNALDTINTSDSSLPPWGGALAESGDMTNQFVNIEYMALAYSMKGSAYYKDENVLEKIIYSLEWMYENAYGTDEMANNGWRDTKLHNWWDWQIGSPRSLVNTLILMEESLDAEFIKKEAEVLEHFVPRTKDYGSNLMHFAKIMIGSALLNGNTQKLQSALDAIGPEFEFDTEKYGQGFHEDGTYLFHTRHFHNGSYGSSHFMLLSEIAMLVKDTAYELDYDLAGNLFEMYKSAFEPLIYDNYMISLANGRSPADSISTAHNIMRAMLDTVALSENKAEFTNEVTDVKATLKKYFSSESLMRITPIKQAEFAANIVNDPDVLPAEDYNKTKIYTDGDKAVHHTDSFMTAVAMSSERVYNYECINSKNMNGWYMADGMQYTYMDGDVQYKSDWWNRSDPYKRPGTTVDTQTRQEVAIKQGNEYLSSKDFVGGVSLGNTGVAVMDLESYHNETGGTTTNTGNGAAAPLHNCSLTAKKAWFMFDDEVVSLGNDINANDGFEVRTIVDNRKMTKGSVLADGYEILEGTFENTGYLNLENKLGYVFPEGENITLNINDSNPDFTEAWISHGVSPQNEKYAYITLPQMNAEQTKVYAEAPDANILANSPSVQAVCDTSSRTTGYVFWEAGSFNGIKSDNACTLVTTENDGYTSVAVSDPTHKLTSITLTFENSIIIPLKSYNGITFKAANEGAIVTVDTSDLSGKSHEFSYFKVSGKISGVYAKDVKLQTDTNSASAAFTIANPTNTASEVTVILAIYTESGNELSDVIFKSVPTGAMQTASDRLYITSDHPFKAKAFVWKSLCLPQNLPIENYDG